MPFFAFIIGNLQHINNPPGTKAKSTLLLDQLKVQETNVLVIQPRYFEVDINKKNVIYQSSIAS